MSVYANVRFCCNEFVSLNVESFLECFIHCDDGACCRMAHVVFVRTRSVGAEFCPTDDCGVFRSDGQLMDARSLLNSLMSDEAVVCFVFGNFAQ